MRTPNEKEKVAGGMGVAAAQVGESESSGATDTSVVSEVDEVLKSGDLADVTEVDDDLGA